MPGHVHAVQFYREATSLCRIVAEFVAEGLRDGDPAIVIATAGHRAAIDAELRSLRFDVDMLVRARDFVMLDARGALAEFMIDGKPHHGAFKHLLGNMLDEVGRGRGNCTPRIYGEMVNVLWKDGLTEAALQLEQLGNEVLKARDVRILCGYSMGNFYKAGALDAIRCAHTHVVNDAGAFTLLS